MNDLTPKRKTEFVWEVLPDSLMRLLWCDQGYVKRINAMDGVASAYSAIGLPYCTVSFDPRYDIEDVIAAIEAIITGGADAQEEV